MCTFISRGNELDTTNNTGAATYRVRFIDFPQSRHRLATGTEPCSYLRDPLLCGRPQLQTSLAFCVRPVGPSRAPGAHLARAEVGHSGRTGLREPRETRFCLQAPQPGAGVMAGSAGSGWQPGLQKNGYCWECRRRKRQCRSTIRFAVPADVPGTATFETSCFHSNDLIFWHRSICQRLCQASDGRGAGALGCDGEGVRGLWNAAQAEETSAMQCVPSYQRGG